MCHWHWHWHRDDATGSGTASLSAFKSESDSESHPAAAAFSPESLQAVFCGLVYQLCSQLRGSSSLWRQLVTGSSP